MVTAVSLYAGDLLPGFTCDSLEFEDFGQYNFYATANTRVPNDQKDFAEFCYGDMVSGKEGNDFALMKNNPRIGSIVGQS